MQSRREGLRIARVRLDAGITSATRVFRQASLVVAGRRRPGVLQLTLAQTENAWPYSWGPVHQDAGRATARAASKQVVTWPWPP